MVTSITVEGNQILKLWGDHICPHMWWATQSSFYPTQLPNTTPGYHLTQLFYLGEASENLSRKISKQASSGRRAKTNMETEE